jgi:transposase
MDPRQQRGLMIAALCRICEKKSGLWTVPSQSGGGFYWVRLDPEHPTCTCKDFEARQQKCKHVYAVEYVVQRETNTNADGSQTETITETVMVKPGRVIAERKTYKQVWPAYHAAQRNEKDKFQVLLADLCKGIVEPPQEKGRPRISLRDMVFAAVFKVYSTVSCRRFMCDLDDAREKGHIGKAPHYNTIFKYLEMPGLTPLLKAMIAESSLPLRAVETDYAVDSSGFSTSRFVRWFDHKYGQPKAVYDWVKVHLMTGTKSNIVTAVEIADRNSHDSPQFKPLFNTTVGNGFRIGEVSADAAYLSHENMEMVGEAGGTPYICFKSNTTAAAGGLMAKMFHMYNLNRDEYLAHYHKRSNVETTNAMIKAKFGDSIRSKTDVAMTNEALCKVLCHNLCVLIQSHYELGINATFWGDTPAETAPAPIPEPNDFSELMAWV